MELAEQQIKEYLQRISSILMINSGFLNNPGLFNGEMGLALFFFKYSKFTQNRLYLDYGFDLIEKLQAKINNETPIVYKQGLTGIGCAFEYLVQLGLIEANTDDVLEEFDERIFSIEKLPFLSFDDLYGIARYAYWRISGGSTKLTNRKITILKKILPQVVYFMEENCKEKAVVQSSINFFKKVIVPEKTADYFQNTDYKAWEYLCCRNSPYRCEPNVFSRLLVLFSEKDFIFNNTVNLGFDNGLAGFGVTLMTEIDDDYSWISLLPNEFCCH